MTKKEFYASLPEKVKAKIRACRSEEEMRKILEQEKIELSVDVLDTVAGGGHGPCMEKWKVLENCPEDDCFCN